jgi:probable phosphoglycerate mutase
VYSSPSKRALKTADTICNHHTLKPVIINELMEMNFGDWEGMHFNDIRKKYPEQYFDFWYQPDKYRPVNGKGELFCQVKTRSVFTIRSLVKIHPNEEIIVVTHGALLIILMSFFTQKKLSEVWNPFAINNGSRTIVEINNNSSRIHLYSDVTHLKTESTNVVGHW